MIEIKRQDTVQRCTDGACPVHASREPLPRTVGGLSGSCETLPQTVGRLSESCETLPKTVGRLSPHNKNKATNFNNNIIFRFMKRQIKSNRVFKFMRTHIAFYQSVFVFVFCLALSSCDSKPTEEPEDSDFDVWVLNEGLWNGNNGSITAYNTSTQATTADIYSSANNGQLLGDTPNDIQLYGSKVYVAVSVSSQINVLDAQTGVSVKQLPIAANGTGSQPRQIACHNGKVYVCCFDGSVVKIDTATLEIESTAKAGRNPDGICVANNKLYVSNSGGMDFPNYDNTVSVFDVNTLAVVKTITVRMNPTQMKADKNGNIYLVSIGNYDDTPSALQRINTTTDQVEELFEGISGFDMYNDYLYFYYADFMLGTTFQIFDILQDSIVNKNFISGGDLPTTPNGISVNPRTGDVYIFDALDYKSTGDVYCFDKNGNKKFTFEAGIIPKKAIFK